MTARTTDAAAPPAQSGDTRAGVLYAVGAYGFWGFLPLYLKALAHLPTLEVIAHRVLWSVPVAGAVLLLRGRMGEVWDALRSPRLLAMAALTAALISLNWGVYVWAIANDRAVEAALGYYINPLFSVALGAVVLRERLSVLQWIAVGLALAAVLVLTIAGGEVPVVALVLTVSFGLYGFFRKTLPLGANQGFFLEVVLLSLPALAWLMVMPGPNSFGGELTDTLLLAGCGIVTAVPLMLYANGAKGLRLSTIGILQYIAPTMIFLIAVFLFGEPFGPARAIAFPMIWAALVLYTVSLWRGRDRGRDHVRAG